MLRIIELSYLTIFLLNFIKPVQILNHDLSPSEYTILFKTNCVSSEKKNFEILAKYIIMDITTIIYYTILPKSSLNWFFQHHFIQYWTDWISRV